MFIGTHENIFRFKGWESARILVKIAEISQQWRPLVDFWTAAHSSGESKL